MYCCELFIFVQFCQIIAILSQNLQFFHFLYMCISFGLPQIIENTAV